MTTSREAELLEFLRTQIAQRTQLAQGDIQADAPLGDLGLQSIDAVLMCGDVEDRFGIEMDPAAVFEHDTLNSFAQYVLQQMQA
tara:strand:- start:1261 stop:1512 length:252 start_codon:yes stop_codon:yes gene_type:complete